MGRGAVNYDAQTPHAAALVRREDRPYLVYKPSGVFELSRKWLLYVRRIGGATKWANPPLTCREGVSVSRVFHIIA